MENFEQEKGFETVTSGEIAELYGLVQLGLDMHEAEGDEISKGASFGRYSKDGLYLGFVNFAAINPLYETNRIGVCAWIFIGDLEEGVPLGIEDVHARNNLDHIIKSYYIYYDGPELKIVKGTNINKPAEVDDKTEAEDLVELSSMNESLNEVYADELEEVIAEVKKALGIKEETGTEAEDLPQAKQEKGWIRRKAASILGKLSLKPHRES